MYQQHTFFLMIIFAITASSIHPNQFRQLQNDIGIVARFCKPDELLVDSGGWRLKAADFVAKGFAPVRIVIDNKSDRAVLMSEQSTKFAIDIDALTSRFKRYEIGRPLGFIAGTMTVYDWTLYLGRSYYGVANLRRIVDELSFSECPLMLIPTIAGLSWLISIVYGPFYWYKLRKANKKLPGKLMNALHAGPISILPHKGAEKIILIPVDLQRSAFPLELFDEADGSSVVQFYIDLDTRK